MSEFITIQVGQCGNQIGSCLLPEILSEYGVKTSQGARCASKYEKTDLQQCITSFFNINRKFKAFDNLSDLISSDVKARFLCIDMEDSVVARLRSGKFRGLYDRKCLITNYPGSGNNWAEGYFTHGPRYKHKILKAIQYSIEQCDNLHGFLLFFSMGGGTGAGLGTFIVKLLKDYYPNIERFVVCIYPIGTEDVITCPYNMAFSTRELLNNATCVFPVENRALIDITKNQTRRYSKFTAIHPFQPFEDLNKIVVDMVLHLTSGSRFSGALNIDMNDINTNMVPFPKMNFLSTGFSPFMLKTFGDNAFSKNELFSAASSRNNQLIKVDPLDSSYTAMSVALLGRGNYTVNDLRGYIDKLHNKLRCPPWSTKGVKVGLCNVAPQGLECSIFFLSNTTAVLNLFSGVLNQFMKLYQRKAHVHHYTAISEFDVQNFKECQNSLSNIIQLYRDIGQIQPNHLLKNT